MRRRLASVVLVSAAIAAACSSSDDGAAVTVEVTEASTTTAAPSPEATSTTAAPTTPSSTTVPSTTTTEPPTTTTEPPDDERPLPETGPGFTDELERVELALRDPATPADRWPALGRRQQQLYRALTVHPDWFDDVERDLDPEVLPAVTLNWEARRQLSSLVSSGDLATTVPAWRIVEPLPAEELLGHYRAAEAETGVPWSVLAAIHLVETRMGRIEGLSTAGALGPMQFLPSTWDWCCEGDPTDAGDAIRGAATYLRISGAPDDMRGAVFAYNRSDRYVDAVLAYAGVLAENELAYRGYHAWDVYYLSAAGLLRLAPGYLETEAVDAATWAAEHPEALLLVD